VDVPEKGGEGMSSTAISTLGFSPETDEEGFLKASETWTRDTAEALARQEVSGGLTQDHWKVIDYLRNYYLKFDTVPPVKKLCRDTGVKYNCICKLFPSGLTKGACRIAGIPRWTIKPCFLYP
jgi:tRNA 2-thiouridine synthesizing protein E